MITMDSSVPNNGAVASSINFEQPDYISDTSANNLPPSAYSYIFSNRGEAETDPEFIKSEMSFYNTPLTEKYAEVAYGAVQNIQYQCAADFQNICPESTPFMNLNEMMAQLLMPAGATYVYRGRKLNAVKTLSELQTGAEYVDYLRSFYRPLQFGRFGEGNPLSHVMYRDSASGKFVSPDRKEKDSSHLRVAKPGWTMPGISTSTDSTTSSPAGNNKLSSKPRSYSKVKAGGAHMQLNIGETHRRLRLAAPGWKPPVSAPTAVAAADVDATAPDAEELKGYFLNDALSDISAAAPASSQPRPPCAGGKTADAWAQTQQPQQVQGSQSFSFDVRPFISDFFSGRDVSFAILPSLFQQQGQFSDGNTVMQFVRVADDDDDATPVDDGNYYYGDGGGDDGAYYYYYAADDDAGEVGGLEEDDDVFFSDDDDDRATRAEMRSAASSSATATSASTPKVAQAQKKGRTASSIKTMLTGVADRLKSKLGDRRGARSELPSVAAQPHPQPRAQQPVPVPVLSRAAIPIGEYERRDRDGPGSASAESEEGEKAGSVDAEDDHNNRDHHDHEHHHHGDSHGSSEDEQGGWWGHSMKAMPGSSATGSSGEGGRDKGHHHRHHREEPPRPPLAEDRSFAGNLGFGAEGDICLYRGMAQGAVSQPCVAAVADLYQLRAQYWEESQAQQYQYDAPHHHGMLGLVVVALLLLGCVVRRVYAARYDKKVRSLLTALHTHPHLKASVEAETGVQVPVPKVGCCLGASTATAAGATPQGSRMGCLARTCKALSLFVCLMFVSFVISFTSLEVTMHIVSHLDSNAQEDPNTGEAQSTSPLGALSILFLVCTAELVLLTLVVKALRAMCTGRRCCEESNDALSASSAAVPSAPYHDTAGTSTRGAGGNGNGGGGLVGGAQSYLASLRVPSINLFGRPSSARFHPAEGYSALPGDEMDTTSHGSGTQQQVQQQGTEMVSFSSYPAQYSPYTLSAAAAATCARPPQQQHAAVPAVQVMVPVTARPVNSISMV